MWCCQSGGNATIFLDMLLAQSKASQAVIAKATKLSKLVTKNDDGSYSVPGSESTHKVILEPKPTCDCKSRFLCSHILAVEFYLGDKEWQTLVSNS